MGQVRKVMGNRLAAWRVFYGWHYRHGRGVYYRVDYSAYIYD